MKKLFLSFLAGTATLATWILIMYIGGWNFERGVSQGALFGVGILISVWMSVGVIIVYEEKKK